jgi:predicted RND superfamily exporter protein
MGIIKKYSEIVSNKPLIVILFCLLMTIVFIYGATLVKTQTMEYKNMLPQGIDEIKAINMIGSEFNNSGNQLIFVIELDSQEINSTEPKDVRDYRIALYLNEQKKKLVNKKCYWNIKLCNIN